MDLALELGMTVAELSSRMTERELFQWNRYDAQKMLPVRRMEVYLAQIAMLIAMTMGGAKNVKLGDFLIELEQPEEVEEISDEELEELKNEIGFKPVAWRK